MAGLGARTGSLVASGAVFFLPSLLLAMVSPLGVRLAAAERVEHLGRSAGQLYAISTAGSIVGTIATAFWLIPLLSLDGLVVAIGFTLFGAALLALTLPGRYEELAPARARASSAQRVADRHDRAGRDWVRWPARSRSSSRRRSKRASRQSERVIYRKDTQYHRLLVTEDGTERVLRFDRSRQSAMYLDDPYETSFHYPNYLHLVMAAKPDAKRVLIVGLGGGSLVKRMWRDYPQVTIDAVEIDPVVVEVAQKYFDLPSDPRINVIAEDGRRFLAATDKTYDIIVMDAYYADALPSHLTTTEFFESAKDHLTPGGVLAYNVIASVDGDRSKLFRSMYRTVGGVWKTLWAFPIGYGSDGGVREQNRNIIVLATDGRLSADELLARVRNRVGGRVTVPDFERYGADLLREQVETSDVPTLTDQHAPTDSLIEVN